MNIMLTDIRSLTLEMQELPVVTQGGDDSFPHLLQQQLPADTENTDQVIEFNKYFERISDASQTPEPGAVGPAVAAWQDFLAQQQIRITTDIDPVAATQVDIGTTLLNQPQTIAATGEQLPFGGNSLPDDSIGGVAVPRGENMPTVLSVDSAIAALNSTPVAAESLVNPDQPALTPIPVPDTGSSVASAPANLNGDRLQSVVAGSIPARLAGGQPSPVAPASSDVTYAAEIANGNEPDARAKIPASVSQVSLTRTDATGERMLNSAALADDQPDGLAVSAGLTREASISGSGANAGFYDLPGTTGTATQSLKNSAEAVGSELAANRNLELPQQISTSQAQQAITASSAGGHGHTITGTVTAPSAIQNALPTELETMSLARAANAGEWGDGLGERVHWMINQKQNSATIRLDPPMLGKLDVQIKIADDATTITIQTQHAQTRDLIETASVRLRDFLQENGYQNVNVDVSQRQDQQQARSQAAPDENSGDHEELQSGQESVESQHRSAGHFMGDSLLDTFA